MKKLSKILAVALAVILTLACFAACSDKNYGDGSGTANNTDTDNKQSKLGEITVITREDGSGTRGAFIELTGLEVKNADGKKVDNTTAAAEITNSTSVMMTSVAGNKNAVGYISLGSLNDTVKALKVDGVAVTVENIKSGSYKIARPFNIATKGEGNDLTKDFISFILSTEGQQVVEKNGFIKMDNSAPYTASGLTGKITVAGSSSVAPVMEKLKEAYENLNSGVTVDVQQNDSTTGMTSAMEGACDIGMASRELKDSEKAALTSIQIATDGIAVIVNRDNPTENLTIDQIREIYTGNTTEWADIK